ncbi:hypothetical protein [Botrimarina sp.]|uniref:sodium:solute symporter family transporter n=1 Tax=Botrimarina sp. TaxID=2795802 RepID=UPI0032EDA563
MIVAELPIFGRLAAADYWIVAAYLVGNVALGAWFARRGTKDAAAYFAGSGQIPWWIAGTSLLVACFAADTPLWIGDIIYRRGLEGVWLYWAPAIGTAFFVLLIAPLWKRSGVLTDVEFLELRYSGRLAPKVRLLNSVFYAAFASIMWMCLQTLSIVTILQSITDLTKLQCVIVTVAVAASYTVVSGLWGVASSGALQFLITYVGSVILAIYAVFYLAGGIGPMVSGVNAMKATWPQGADLNVLPSGGPYALPAMTLVALFCFRWLEQAGMGQQVAQRLIASKSPRQAVYTAMIWGVGFFAVVPLPWIVTVIAARVLLPDLTDGQEAYPRLAMMLPVGFRGVLVASMLAAFMSTYSSLMSWGSSLAINDAYRRFLVRGKSESHYVRAAQVYMLVMAVVSAYLALLEDSVLDVVLFVLTLTSGYWVVMILRWVWWRINAWAELGGLIGSVALSLISMALPYTAHWWDDHEAYFGHRMVFVVVGSLVLSLALTLATPATDREIIDRFYARVRPPGFWGPVRKRLGLPVRLSGWTIAKCWGVMLVGIYGPLFGLLKITLGDYAWGAAATALGAVAIWLAVRLAQELYSDEAEAELADEAARCGQWPVAERPSADPSGASPIGIRS